MNAERKRLARAICTLSLAERTLLTQHAQATSKIERIWRRKYSAAISEFDVFVFRRAADTGKLNFDDIDFGELVARQAFEVSAFGEDQAHVATRQMHLASPPRIRMPSTFNGVRELYDRYRRTGKLPARQQDMADKLKRYYIERCQSVWKKYARDFIKGKEFNQNELKAILAKEGDMAKARANTIANTETTNYYNAARTEVYDRSPDVTHYLFVAIRDRATTKWCRSRQGLVFTKGTKLCKHNTPACHWNCRSEMLPLTAQNPRHRALIDDLSLRAENNRLVPLPKGWKTAA